MLRIEILPFGQEEWKETLAMIEIANIGKNADETHNYMVTAEDDEGNVVQAVGIKGFNRGEGFWALIALALEELKE